MIKMNKLPIVAALLFAVAGIQELSAQKSFERVIITPEEMFKLASENNKQLKLSGSGIEIAKKATETEQNSRLPSIEVTIAASYLGDGLITDRDFTNPTTASMPHFGNSFSLEASQVIYAGGTISNTLAKSRLQEQIAQLNFEKEEMNVRFQLIGNYLDLYKLMNEREVYLKNKEQTTFLINQIKAKQQEGMALNNDVTRHELMLQHIEFALLEIDNDCKILNDQLVTSLGLPDSTLVLPDPAILHLPLTPVTQAELLEVAEHNLPGLKTADISIAVAEKNISIAKAEYLPAIALVAGDNLNGPITLEVPPINKNYHYWYAGIGITYNLASLYSADKMINLAKAQQHSANEAKSVIREQSVLAVKSACINYQESFDKLHTLEKSAQLAKENYEVIYHRYVNDIALITEMLDASNSELNAELQVVNATINIVFNYYHLKYISGTL